MILLYMISIFKKMYLREISGLLSIIVTAWCVNNGMVLYASKTKVFLITTPQTCAQLVNKTLWLHYKNVNLELTTGDKILGVYINENLKWDNHVTFIRRK